MFQLLSCVIELILRNFMFYFWFYVVLLLALLALKNLILNEES